MNYSLIPFNPTVKTDTSLTVNSDHQNYLTAKIIDLCLISMYLCILGSFTAHIQTSDQFKVGYSRQELNTGHQKRNLAFNHGNHTYRERKGHKNLF